MKKALRLMGVTFLSMTLGCLLAGVIAVGAAVLVLCVVLMPPVALAHVLVQEVRKRRAWRKERDGALAGTA